MSWVPWNNICTPKLLRRVALQKLEDQMMAQRFNLLKDMCIGPWVEIVGYFMENIGIYHRKTRITTSWWHLVNITCLFKCEESNMVQ
mgnify:CR=1 FL=1